MKGWPWKRALAFLDKEGFDNMELGYQDMEGCDNHHSSGFVL